MKRLFLLMKKGFFQLVRNTKMLMCYYLGCKLVASPNSDIKKCKRCKKASWIYK